MDVFLKLKKNRALRRIIEGAVTVLSLTALIVMSVLKEKSRIVTTIGTPPFSYDKVQYAKDYAIPILVSAMIFAVFGSLLLADFLCARVYYSRIDGQDVIVYNGAGPVKLLIDGEEKDVMLFKGYLKAKLKSGVNLIVSPQFFMSYHITFSDNRPAIDL